MRRYPVYKDSGVEWLGEIPEHWEIQRLKRYLKKGKAGLKIGPFGSAIKSNIIKSKTEFNNQKYKVYGQEQVIGNDFDLGDKYIDKESFEQLYNYQITPGDIVITMMGTTGKAMVVPQSIEPGIMDSHLIRISPIDNEIINYFLAFIINNSYYVYTQIKTDCKGSIMEGLNSSIIKSLFIIKPPLSEQKAIAHFLDYKIEQIEQYIRNKQRLIELLNEQKTAIINRAVTKGINPNAPMKHSGIEWLGEIPAHWDIASLAYICSITSGGTPDRNRREYWNGKIPWVKTGEINYHDIEETEEFITERGLINSSAKIMPPGTLLMAMYGQGVTRGRVAILRIEAAFNQACLAISPRNCLETNYLYYFFVSCYEFIRDTGNETSQMNLSAGLIKKLKVLLPPLEEQRKIVAFLDKESVKINQAIAQIEKEIELIQEYRTTLISDAVTGKIDVRGFDNGSDSGNSPKPPELATM